MSDNNQQDKSNQEGGDQSAIRFSNQRNNYRGQRHKSVYRGSNRGESNRSSRNETEYHGPERGGYKSLRNDEAENRGLERGGYNRGTRNAETEHHRPGRGGNNRSTRNDETGYQGSNRGGYNRRSRNDEAENQGLEKGGYNRSSRNAEMEHNEPGRGGNNRSSRNDETEYRGSNRGGYNRSSRNDETEYHESERGGNNINTRNDETEDQGSNRGGYNRSSRNDEAENQRLEKGGYNRSSRNAETEHYEPGRGGNNRSSGNDEAENQGLEKGGYNRSSRNAETEHYEPGRGGNNRSSRNDEIEHRGSNRAGGYNRGSRNDERENWGSNQYSRGDRSRTAETRDRGKSSRSYGRSYQNRNYNKDNRYQKQPYEPGKNVNAPPFTPWGKLEGTHSEQPLETKTSNAFLETSGENLEGKTNLPKQLTDKCVMQSESRGDSLNHNKIVNPPAFNPEIQSGTYAGFNSENSVEAQSSNALLKAPCENIEESTNDDRQKSVTYEVIREENDNGNNLRTDDNKKETRWDKKVSYNIKPTNSNDNWTKSDMCGDKWQMSDDDGNEMANSSQCNTGTENWDVSVEDKSVVTSQVSSNTSDNWDDDEHKNINSYQACLEKNETNSIDKNDSQGESILNSSSEIDIEEGQFKQPGLLEGNWNNNEKNYKKLSVQSTNRLSEYNQSTINYENTKLQRKTIGRMSTEKNEKNTSDDKDFLEYDNKFRFKRLLQFKIVQEKNGDLFEMPEEYALANCVAEDMNMGSGIAVTFRQKFKGQDELLAQKPKQGGIAFLTTEQGRYIYYLVTKRESNLKPTLETLFKSLKKLKGHMVENNVKKLAIPRLGCGLDRLEWRDVKNMLEYIFGETDTEIIVCNYEKAAETMQEQNKNHHMRRCKLEILTTPIVKIEEYTIIIYFGTEDGYVSPQMEELDRRFDIIKHYRSSTRNLGEFLFVDKFNYKYPHYGCIVRKTSKQSLDFNALSKCITEINKINRKYKNDAYCYVAFQEFEDPEDDLIMKKVVNIMRNTFWGITLYVCPK